MQILGGIFLWYVSILTKLVTIAIVIVEICFLMTSQKIVFEKDTCQNLTQKNRNTLVSLHMINYLWKQVITKWTYAIFATKCSGKIKKIVTQKYHLIISRDIDDQRSLESDWPNSTPAQTQPRVVVLNATFLDDYFHAKN